MSTNRFGFRIKLGVLAICLTMPLFSQAQSFPPAFSKTASYAAGDIVQYGGNWYRAMKALSANGPYPASAYGDWELNYVRSNTTLVIGVGQPFANLVYAWQFGRNARIADAAYLHFSISTQHGNFTETFNGPFSLDHGSGALISIIGDVVDNITLNFPANTNGLVIDTGHTIAAISGVQITGVLNAASFSSYSGGIQLISGTICNLTNAIISQFTQGINASEGSTIVVYQGLEITACMNGIQASYSSTVLAPGVHITLGAYQGGVSTEGIGLRAADNATISCENANIGNAPAFGQGVVAQDGGLVDVAGATVSEWRAGCEADSNGHIDAESATLKNNTYDISVAQAGTVNDSGATLYDPTEQGTNDGSFIFTTAP